MTEYQKYFLKVHVATLLLLILLLGFVEFTVFTLLLTICFYIVFYIFGLNLVHRCITHRQATLTKFGKITATYVMLFTMIGDPITFSNIHRYHHRHSDTQLDPHTPVKGKIYAFIGWLFDSNREQTPYTNVKDLLRDSFLKFILANQVTVIWTTIVISAFVSLNVTLALCLAMWVCWIKESIGTSIVDHSAAKKTPMNNKWWSWIGLTDYHNDHHINPNSITDIGPSNFLYSITKAIKITA